MKYLLSEIQKLECVTRRPKILKSTTAEPCFSPSICICKIYDIIRMNVPLSPLTPFLSKIDNATRQNHSAPSSLISGLQDTPRLPPLAHLPSRKLIILKNLPDPQVLESHHDFPGWLDTIFDHLEETFGEGINHHTMVTEGQNAYAVLMIKSYLHREILGKLEGYEVVEKNTGRIQKVDASLYNFLEALYCE